MLKSVTIIALSALFTLSAFAQDEVTRTDKTDNSVVVMVGKCSISAKLDFNNQEVFESTLPVTQCQEYKTYRATLSGKSWNKTVTPIAGTETYSYKMEDATQVRTESPSTSSIMDMVTAMANCNDRRNLLVKLAQAQQGQAKCKL